jgi:carboxymethylenebutenolidase
MDEFTVAVPTSEGPMDLHGFVPQAGSAGRIPALIVLQEAFGVNPHVKRVCRRVAELGYAAFAPELFHRSGRGAIFGYDEFPKVRSILAQLTNERILEDLRAAYRYVAGMPQVDPGRIAAWGFCMGGWASVFAACELPLAAAISFYGGGMVRAREGIAFTPIVGRLGEAGCPLLLVYGGKDPSITPEDIGAVRAALSSHGKPHEVEIYPEGGHGFFCEDRAAYHEASAKAAWTRAAGWLCARLAQGRAEA